MLFSSLVDDIRQPPRKSRGPDLAQPGQQRGREAAVDAAAVDGARDVEARADLALGGAVCCLRKVVEGARGGWGGGEVEGEEGGGQGGDEGGGGAEAGFVG